MQVALADPNRGVGNCGTAVEPLEFLKGEHHAQDVVENGRQTLTVM